MRWALIVLYGTIGAIHLAAADKFLPIMPEWVPQPRAVVIATGLCELAGVIGLLLPRWRRLAGIMLALYAICVFPANIRHALEGIPVPGLPDSWWYHGPRLAFQPVLVWWALYATRIVDWPLRRRVDRAIPSDPRNGGEAEVAPWRRR
ncbi:MAG TPA: DoxX family protein [Methylobacterium sp.]|jgi:uncharacterized membrane protein